MTKILYSNLESSTRFSSARYSSSKLIVIHAYVHVFCRLAEAPTTQTASCIRQLLNVYAAQPAASAPAADELPGVEDTISTKILRRMHGAVYWTRCHHGAQWLTATVPTGQSHLLSTAHSISTYTYV